MGVLESECVCEKQQDPSTRQETPLGMLFWCCTEETFLKAPKIFGYHMCIPQPAHVFWSILSVW